MNPSNDEQTEGWIKAIRSMPTRPQCAEMSSADPQRNCSGAVEDKKIYIYMKGTSGQTLAGEFLSSKLVKLVKHFIRGEELFYREPPNDKLAHGSTP